MKYVFLGISVALFCGDTALAGPLAVQGHTYELRFAGPFHVWDEPRDVSHKEIDVPFSHATGEDHTGSWEYLVINLTKTQHQTFWLGGFKSTLERGWDWLTGRLAGNEFTHTDETGNWGGVRIYLDDWEAVNGTDYPSGRETGGFNLQFESSPVPEPATVFLLGAGLSFTALFARRKKA